MSDDAAAYWKRRAEAAWELGDQQALALLQARAQLAEIRQLCVWSADEPHMRAHELVKLITEALDETVDRGE